MAYIHKIIHRSKTKSLVAIKPSQENSITTQQKNRLYDTILYYKPFNLYYTILYYTIQYNRIEYNNILYAILYNTIL